MTSTAPTSVTDPADPVLDLAADVWRRMATFSFARFQRGAHFEILRELGLTPGHLKALSVLDPQEPRPMRALADALVCDASMATWLVDRLEEKGLVERRPMPNDRRVKTVALTPLGVETRARLRDAIMAPPEELLGMDERRLEALRRALSHLPPTDSSPFWSSADDA
jgi:DNA-binding MarR family transcriptional regulator